MFQILLSGVPQVISQGPLLFSIFTNELFCFMNDTQLINFADDITIPTVSNSVDNLITEL